MYIYKRNCSFDMTGARFFLKKSDGKPRKKSTFPLENKELHINLQEKKKRESPPKGHSDRADFTSTHAVLNKNYSTLLCINHLHFNITA